MIRSTMGINARQIRVGAQGRVVIPAALRNATGIDIGMTLLARGEPGRVILETPDAVIARIRARFRKAVPGPSVVDELLRERRVEAERDATGP